MRVKICGITNYEDAMAACEAGADLLGFNFAEEAKKRNRYIEVDEAYAIIERLPDEVLPVVVCVNESLERMETFLEHVDYVQLHGEEPVETTKALGAKAIKVFRLSNRVELSDVEAYTDCFAYLVDAYSPDERGGTGNTCDWDMAASIVALSKPLFLAGGLRPENVAEAIQKVRPYAVDTAGGVESEPGKKDYERIRAFIDNAKQASLS
jgi:phosphoribosylanthranilate isomerase